MAYKGLKKLEKTADATTGHKKSGTPVYPPKIRAKALRNALPPLGPLDGTTATRG